MKKKSMCKYVLEYYPKAKAYGVGNEYIVSTEDGPHHVRILGRGKNARCAWASAYKNYIL